MTVMHHIVDSEFIEDTDAKVLHWVNKYIEQMKACEGHLILARAPLRIEREIKSFDPPGTFARVYARWSTVDDLLPKHASSCSNQNVLNPLGAYLGVKECGCAPSETERRAQNDTPCAVQRVVMSWFPPQ